MKPHQIDMIILLSFLMIGWAAIGGAAARDEPADPRLADRPAKRGVCGSGKAAAPLKAGWYYTWYIEPAEGVDAEFVPMIAHGKDANSWYFDKVMELKKQGKAKCLLGFNEPERKEQGNVSVDDAIKAWPLLMKPGLRLGSPAVSSDNAGQKWLEEFMVKAAAKKYRIDFLAVHWYRDASEPDAPAKFMAWVQDLHHKYGLPVWVTEFAGMNWGFVKHPVTAEVNQRFLSELEPMLEKSDIVERYAWFSGGKESSLYSNPKKLELNALGEIYRDGGRIAGGGRQGRR